jgi:hypothetical protein
MNEAERQDYWANKTGKEFEDIELEDIGTTEGYYYDDDYYEAIDYTHEDLYEEDEDV